MRKTIITLAIILGGAVALPGCGSSGPCIILANGGNKLCGDDAKAWCDSTDQLRDGAQDFENQYGDGDDTSISDSQAVCDEVRGQ